MKERFLIVILLMLCTYVLISSDFGNQSRVYDCNIAEWHPDIPKYVREECRRLRKENRENNYQYKTTKQFL